MKETGIQKALDLQGNRRQFLKSITYLSTMGAAGLYLPRNARTEKIATDLSNLNGSPEPFPIPWLDKNGSHNQSPGPDMDPSEIYHFKGEVARCNNFIGMGTDNQGNRIAFGAPSTDFSFMKGEYWAARATQKGIFSHV